VANVVASHVRKCRELKSLQYAIAIIIPESNLPFCSRELQKDMKEVVRLDNHIFMTEDSSGYGVNGRKDLPGSITTHNKKLEMVDILINTYLQQNRICFHQPFIVSQEDIAGVESVQLEVVSQLRGFKKRRKHKFDADDQVVCQIIYTGKEPAGKNDDFVMALLIAVYNYREFMRLEKYRPYRIGK
jgi:hypothetical protein